MAAQDELTLLAGELARKIEGTKTCQVFARGVPGITHETFTSEAAVRALMTCERLFEVDDEEKSPQRRKRVFIFAEHNGKWGNNRERLELDGIFAKSFPIQKLETINTFQLEGDLAKLTKDFNSGSKDTPTPFGTTGIMVDRQIITGKASANYSGEMQNLASVLQNPGKIPDTYILDADSLLREKGWIYLKGGKKELRKGTDGFTYRYSEGPVTFPDALDRASRTVVTGEGGSSPSRFKHVVKFKPTKKQIERLDLQSSESRKVREKLGIPKNQWLRRLTPVELERLNGFPDNHTELASDSKRAFFMGNALVCGIVERIASKLPL